MNTRSLKQFVLSASFVLATVGAQAAQVITFPTGTLTTSNTVYQLTSGIASNGEFQAGLTSVTGFGVVNTLTQNQTSTSLPNVTFCGGTPNCELTYTFGGFTYTGGFKNNVDGNGVTLSRDFYFSGGTFGLFVDFTPDAVAPAANSTVSQFATAGQKFSDGTTILTSAARAGGTLTGLSGGTPNTTSTTTTSLQSVAPGSGAPSGFGSCVLRFSDPTEDVYRCTLTTTTTTFSITGATLKVTQDLANGGSFSGSVLFDATGGQGFSNFNQNTQGLGTDLSAIISFASPTSCVFNTSTGLQQCAGSSTTSATVTPGTVTVVPEPAMLAIFGSGLLCLAVVRRRRNTRI